MISQRAEQERLRRKFIAETNSYLAGRLSPARPSRREVQRSIEKAHRKIRIKNNASFVSA